MNNIKLKNKIQGLGHKAIFEAGYFLDRASYSSLEVNKLIDDIRFKQERLLAELLRVSEFDDEEDIKRDNAVRRLKRAWFVKGKNPEYHNRSKFRLYKQWRILHNAIEDVVS